MGTEDAKIVGRILRRCESGETLEEIAEDLGVSLVKVECLCDQVQDQMSRFNEGLPIYVRTGARRKLYPPPNAELLLSILVARERNSAVIGCFREIYMTKAMLLGGRRATIWAWCDVAKTFVQVTRQWVLKTLGILSAIEWMRRHLL
jgi:hypothetical protein